MIADADAPGQPGMTQRRRTAFKGGPSLTDHHVRHILRQKETVAGFQGETCFCPVGIFVYVGFHGGRLWTPSPWRSSFMVGNTYVNPLNA